MIKMEPIGYVASERSEVKDDHWGMVQSKILVNHSFSEESLFEIESFSHVEVIFYFHEVEEDKIIIGARHPRNNEAYPLTGIFAQRGKNRPNRLGLTTARIIKREGLTLFVENLDCIDGTPVLDIKPVMKEFLPKGSITQPTWSHELMKHYW
ncbi:SAM-dependent methyltransferase [Alkalicoccobacillus gibsonii]|uniref:SAM-dependent methyltransferase n=1 Tax=Alkalicoccobacillus gibsonii TaxID=79881 RepID=UPI003F7C13DC